MTGAGTRYDADAAGRLTRITDRAGAVHAELSWNGDALIALVVPGAIVHGDVHDDPLLGAAHAIQHAVEAGNLPISRFARMSAKQAAAS